MTNTLVGDVYQKIIEEVVLASTNDFEESGVGQATLNELRQAWQIKLSQRQVAQMPWDPKPEPVQRVQNGNGQMAAAATNGLPSTSYQNYRDDSVTLPQSAAHVKSEPANDQTYAGTVPAGAYPPGGPQQGGFTRAQELVQERFGQQAAAAIQRPGGLALPGQQPKPQGLQLPGQTTQQAQQQYAQQQHQMMQRQQQQVLQNQQANPRIKLENNSPTVPQGQFAPQQRLPNPAYAQTDGADDYAEWQTYITQRRAMHAGQIESNDRMMRDRISALSNEFETGLMLPFSLQRKQRQVHPRGRQATQTEATSSEHIPQLDGDEEDDEEIPEAVKHDDEDDDAINSDLDDPDDDQNPIGDDDDDLGDSILCTYDKVQRVKNKWKCTLKDGVLNTGGKEWLFHKGQGEFEW